MMGVEYVPLDANEEVYSAAQQKNLIVRNIPFDILKDTAEQILGIVVLEVRRRRPGVKRIRLGEVWLSPPCNTFCKMDSINKEHKCRHGPRREPIEGTAKEADKLMAKTLALIAVLVRMKARQMSSGEMWMVEGVELDLRGMENAEGMI